MLLSHREAISKFLNKIDNSKLVYKYFNVMEVDPNRPDFLYLKNEFESYSEIRFKENNRRHKDRKSRSKSIDSRKSESSNDSESYFKQIKIKNGY